MNAIKIGIVAIGGIALAIAIFDGTKNSTLSSGADGPTSTSSPTSSGPAPTETGTLTALIPSCSPDSGVDCTNPIYQKAWARLEAETGEVTKVNVKSIQHFNNGAAELFAYTYVPGTPYDPERMRRLFFNCVGQFRDQTEGFGPVLDAPPRSIAGKMSALACAGAKDTRLEDADKDNGSGETPADYCKGYSDEACDRIIAVIKSRTNPPYCKPGFAIVGSPENQGLDPEQIRICFLMASDFTKLSTTK